MAAAKRVPPSLTAEGKRAARQKAIAEGKCGECCARPRAEGRAVDGGRSNYCAECLNRAAKKNKSNRGGATAKELMPAIDGRLAKPTNDERCFCGKPVAVKGALFCAPHGREYVADLKRRIEK